MAVPSKPTPEPLRQLFALIDKLRHATTGSAGRRAVTANSGWLLFDKLTRSLLGLLVGAWVARHLGPTQFGLLAYVLAFIALFQAIANLGADAIIVRDIAQHPDSAPEILGTALGLRAGFGVLCWAVAVGCVAALNADAPRTILMAAIVGSVLVFQASDTVDLWFQSQSRSRLTVFAKLSAYLLSNGIKVGLILCDAPSKLSRPSPRSMPSPARLVCSWRTAGCAPRSAGGSYCPAPRDSPGKRGRSC